MLEKKTIQGLNSMDWLIIGLCFILLISLVNTIINFSIQSLTIHLLSLFCVVKATNVIEEDKILFNDYMDLCVETQAIQDNSFDKDTTYHRRYHDGIVKGLELSESIVQAGIKLEKLDNTPEYRDLKGEG